MELIPMVNVDKIVALREHFKMAGSWILTVQS